VRIERLEVGPKEIEVLLRFDPGEPLRTTEVPGLAGTLLRALPGLKGHRCDNGADLSFRQEAADTEIAHLIEHATLEIMAMAGSPDALRGTTAWDFAADGRGVFRVRIEYDNELVAIGSLRCAVEWVRAFAMGEQAPDAEGEARRLRRLR